MVTNVDEYDFIVVGGGTAGLVVAARLSEIPNVQVLVVEAGENQLRNPKINIPAQWPSILGSELDWKSSTIPQKELNDRVVNHPHGHLLGGTSAINGQTFVPPSKTGIDAWEQMGNPGWNWKNLEPYTKKSFNPYIPPGDSVLSSELAYLKDAQSHDRDDSVQISYAKSTDDSSTKAWLDAFQSLGHKLSGDPFSGTGIGAFVSGMSVDATTKERSYAASAYYAPAHSRPNLHLMTAVQVEKILLTAEDEMALASGIMFSLDGASRTIKATKEVILAAGSFNTPKLLELSGIGGSNLLESKGIDVIIDNPSVGENLQDHLMTGISFEVKDDVPTLDALVRQDPEAVKAAMMAYQTNKSGPFADGMYNSYAFMPVTGFQTPEGEAELKRLLELYKPGSSSVEYDFTTSLYSSPDQSSGCFFMWSAQGTFGSERGEAGEIFASVEDGNFITIVSLLSYPSSRGSVHIASSSIADKPVIDGGYYTHPLDLEMHAHHLLFIEKIIATEPLASLLKPDGKRSPAFASFGGNVNKAKEYLRKTAASGWHPVGSCAMKPKEKGGVVNERLIVHGTKNLRVVDASVMPLICRGNTQATVYAVAERAADLVKADYGL